MSDGSALELGRQGRALWFGVLTGPVAWLGHLVISYVLASLTCLRAWPGFTLFGRNGGQVIIVVLTLALLVLILVAGWQAYQLWRRLRARAGGRGNGFDHWMAFSGVLLSGMFFVAVAWAGLPAVVLLPCR